METSKTNSKFLLITALIAVAVIFRIIPHPFNFTPVVAIALFGGAKFSDKKWAVLIPVISMFIGDIFLSLMNHYMLFHDTIFFVYGSILLIIFLGRNLQGKLNVGKTALFTLAASILFFVITNIGVWLFGAYIASMPKVLLNASLWHFLSLSILYWVMPSLLPCCLEFMNM